MPRLVGKRYKPLGVIGRGGMGEVWLAENEHTGAHVALKIFRGAGDATLRFRQEAKLAAQLAHPNIVHVYDLLDEDGVLALVMEHLRGETLASVIARAPLDPDAALAATLPILSALEHAHRAGVIHRDLKPANVFLALMPDGTVVPTLLDFGIARPAEPTIHTLEGHTLGTPEYMSPEQIRDSPDLDGRSDLFSMAVVIYEAITGEQPFRKASPSARIGAVLETVVDPSPRIPPKLWQVLSPALSKRAYERPQSAAEFKRDLEGAVEWDVRRGAEELRALVVAQPETLDVSVELPRTLAAAPTSRRPMLVWLGVASAAIAIAALTAVRHETSAGKESAPTASNVTSASTVVIVTSASASSPPMASVDSSPPPIASSAAPHARPLARPTASATQKPTPPKAIATTPGF